TRSELHGARERPHPRRQRPAAPAPRLRAERHELGLRQPAQLGRACLRRRRGRRIPGLVARRRLSDPAGRRHLRYQRRVRRYSGAHRLRTAPRLGGDARRAAAARLAATRRRRDREDLMRWALLALAFAWSAAMAQAYPSRPVRLVVPFPPGSTPDIVGRTLASSLQQALAQPFVVENRTGAGGNIGTEAVAK